MPSHLLANSAFAGLDIYGAGSVKTSKRLMPVPVRPTPPSAPLTQLDAARRLSLALPDSLMPVSEQRPLVPGRSTSSTDDILLNSPDPGESASVQHHATTVDMEGEAKRGPVQMSNVVNWARPFNAEPEEQYLFGQSNQRQRRMGKAAPLSPYVPSPSSSSASSDEESLPTTPGAVFFPSMPFAQSLSGLGMDLPKTDMRSQWSQKQEVARRIHSLPTSAPTTLEELRQLKSAAQQLETEARRRAIVPVAASPLIEQKPLDPVPMRTRRIRRKAVPTILALDSDAVSNKPPQMFTLQVDPMPDTPRSGMSSSKSFSSGPFDLCSASSSSDADSTPPQTPPHAMVAFSGPPITPLPTSSSENSGLRRSPGMSTGLRVSPSLPLYVPSVHGEIDGWWSSSDDDTEGDSQGEEGDVDTESDTSPVPPVRPTFVPVADTNTPVRRGPGFHVRSVSNDPATQTPPRKSFYGNTTAFMSTFFTKPSLASSSTSSSLNRGATVKAAPSAWDRQTQSAPAHTGRRSSLQFLAPRIVSIDRHNADEHDEVTSSRDSSPKKSFYANNKAFRSVMDLGSVRRTGKSKDSEEKVPRLEDGMQKKGIGKFFRKLVI